MQILVFSLVALVAGIFTYELAAVKPNWCALYPEVPNWHVTWSYETL